jgi:hypothetical protein
MQRKKGRLVDEVGGVVSGSIHSVLIKRKKEKRGDGNGERFLVTYLVNSVSRKSRKKSQKM